MTTEAFLAEKKERVLREIETAKAEILKEFLHKAKIIEGYLNQLEQEGFDKQNYLCLEEQEECSYTIVDKFIVTTLLTLFREMRNEEASITTHFESITIAQSDLLLYYSEYHEMMSLEDAFNALKRAGEDIQSSIH